MLRFGAARGRGGTNTNTNIARQPLRRRSGGRPLALLQILQSCHSITCFIRSLAVASACSGVSRDFFANTYRTTTRRAAAVT